MIKLLCGIHPLPSLFSKVGSAPAFLEMIHLSQTIVILEHPSFDSFPSSFPAFPYEFQKNSCEKRSNKNTFRNRFFFPFSSWQKLVVFGVFFRFRKGEFHGQGALVLLSAKKTSIGGLFNKSGSKQNAQNESSR